MEQATFRGFWYGFNITATILTLFFLLLVPILFAFEQFTQNVDIKLEQKNGTFVHMDTILAVTINNASSTPLNAIEFTVIFNPKLISITDIISTGTLCEDRFILENTINNASGTASFACGTITPFSEKNGVVALLHMTPLVSGTSTISFATSSTHVLMHDGLGTNATRHVHDLLLTSL